VKGMPANFEFLRHQPEYAMFAEACIEAERVLATSPAMSAVGSRKALELAFKWVFAADKTMRQPYKDNLQSYLHEPSFRYAVDRQTWGKLPYIVKLGNLAVHTDKSVSRGDAILSLSSLFEFIQWIDYCYGSHYEERHFDESLIPSETVILDVKKIKEQQSLLEQKESEIEALRAQIEALSKQLTANKDKKQAERHFNPEDLSEFETRKRFIDVDLKLLGWAFGDDVREEVELYGMPNPEGRGYADYVLYGKDGLPLAVIEAKRASKDPTIGIQQAKLYADCLERMTGRRPMMFITNGFETWFWDDRTSPQRKVSGIFAKSDLEKLMNRRSSHKPLCHISIDDRISGRYYQKEAIRAVCDAIEESQRKALLVMATGTGKTRTAAGLTDVLSRGGHVTNVLFLADRTALVEQAKDSFKNCLPDMSLCNLLSNKDDRNARVVFSTYPTMLNAIDSEKREDGKRLFTPAHFDLIIVDEAHRSIFRKYRAIFDYFDGIMVGLTATPKDEVDRNTYDFFELENGVPTYAYDYDTAVEKDHVLVPYRNIEVDLKFLEEGIAYDELSEEDKARYEEDFTDEDGSVPDYIPSAALNQFIFNQDTVDRVLEDLMTKGIKVAGGDRIGKTIIFAQNKDHAQYIVERFNKLFPQYHGTFARRVTYQDNYVQSIINDFKMPDKPPHIAVSVDMMDTGIDVPEVVNLVFFKKVRSKTKFWQMIGRGTRLCPNLFGPGEDKTHFVIFDYLGNFEFFRANRDGIEASGGQTLSEAIFAKRVRLVHQMQQSAFADDDHQAFRKVLVDTVVNQIAALNPELVTVRLQLQHVEKFKRREAFDVLTELDVRTLTDHLAPLVYMDDQDEHAKRFDNLLYGLMVACAEGQESVYKRGKKQVQDLCNRLARRMTIPQVKEKAELIARIADKAFWEEAGVLDLEKVRVELRELIKFVADDAERPPIIYTDLKDEVKAVRENVPLGQGYTFEDYKLKVNRYIEENRDHMAIYKLRHNIPLTETDYKSLERIFTGELGTEEDYRRAFQDTPFGLLVRKVAKLEYEAAMQAFSEFINDQSLTQAQIVFVKKVIDYVVQNGYIESVADLTRPPFDKPQSFVRLFDREKLEKLTKLVMQFKENAVKVVG